MSQGPLDPTSGKDDLFVGGDTGTTAHASPILSELLGYHESMARRFLQNRDVSDHDPDLVRNLLSEYINFALNEEDFAARFGRDKARKQLDPAVAPQGFSSVGKVLSSAGKVKSTPSRVTLMMSKNKIVPMESQSLTALSVLSSPEATKYVEDHNKDLETESELVRQMDNVVQHYTEKEDEMISSGIGLLDGMKMKGAIPFKGEAWKRREPCSHQSF